MLMTCMNLRCSLAPNLASKKHANPKRLSGKAMRPLRFQGAASQSASSVASSKPSVEVKTCEKIGNHAAIHQYDFVVIGSGIAGLSYALKVAEYGQVAVITKANSNDGCTKYAQGGICAVLDEHDSVEAHIKDTLIAGAYLNDPRVVEVVCNEGPARVLELVEAGAEFTKNKDGSLHLTREGGHSGRRIVHAADATGKEVQDTLVAAVEKHPNISMFENHLAVELVVDRTHDKPRCFGVDALDQNSGTLTRFVAWTTMLSSGGAGQIYPNTTNPSVATGDGIAIAYRADARVTSMEFVQFHPTSLYTGGESSKRAPLVTEAVRGEGGLLYNMRGERFMPKYDSGGELAPRDIVARAIQDQMLTYNEPHVILDISHKPRKEILKRFPNIAARCQEMDIDITTMGIPVVPAQHYLCGGVHTGLYGETSIQGLFACGEVACTGLHGSNRLASNSLLEALVFAHRAVIPSILNSQDAPNFCTEFVWQDPNLVYCQDGSASQPSQENLEWLEDAKACLRQIMWKHCGITRTQKGLSKALGDLCLMSEKVKAMKQHSSMNANIIELLNMITVAELIVYCAFNRKTSHGLHFIKEADQSQPLSGAKKVVLQHASLMKWKEVSKKKQQSRRTPVPVKNYDWGKLRQTVSARSTHGNRH